MKPPSFTILFSRDAEVEPWKVEQFQEIIKRARRGVLEEVARLLEVACTKPPAKGHENCNCETCNFVRHILAVVLQVKEMAEEIPEVKTRVRIEPTELVEGKGS